MAKCNFSINFSESAESLVAKANNAIQQAGGNFNGDVNAGSFELKTPLGAINGSYTIANSAINMQINDKPLFLSCSRIQDELKKYLQ